jgi:2-hydroxychromene-2-carboxylate isomerase
MAKIQFWYDLASSYSYLSPTRVDALAAKRGLGGRMEAISARADLCAQGWQTSPFSLYPAKGRHMVRDMERICANRGLPFRLPEPFPQNSLQAACLALIGAEDGWGPAFSQALFWPEFGEGAH